ncbi:MFS transporter [Streptomyces sp. NPDC002795]|uniref:MFS transporter n=1 Tax=Streptomyces sp. NPDC002795 TaxID=3364665 RepID=UPI0036AA4395
MTVNAVRPAQRTTAAGTPRKAAVAAWVGSALEYYDFFIYASAAALIFPTVFFPQGNPTVATLASLATFGVGYVARPLGSFFMGHLGDRLGRKKVLVLTLIMMGATTFLVGCLPGYGEIGMAAPALLVVLRMLQGFSAAGEQAGANAMSFEHAPAHRRAFVTSWTLGGTQAGQLLASAVFIPIAAGLSDEALYSWGWRIPFWISALMLVVGFAVRRSLDETPAFENESEQDRAEATPLTELFRAHRLPVLRVFLAATISNIGTVFAVFALTFATDSSYGVDMDRTVLLWTSAAGNALAVLTIPLLALLSDRVGRKPVFLGGIGGCAGLVALFLWSISIGSATLVVVTGVLLIGVAFAATLAVWPAFYAEMFPTRVRLSGMAVGTQFGFATAGTAPLVAAAITPHSPSGWIPVAVYAVVVCAVAAAAVLWSRETFHTPMKDLGRV